MNINKKQLKIAKNYAAALFKIAKEQNSAEKLCKQLNSVVEIINNSADLKDYFENPLISANDKKGIIYKVFGKDFDLQVINVLNLLSDNKRLDLIETVFYCFENLYEEYKNITKVTIYSVVEMKEESKKRLNEILKEKLGSEIISEHKINEEIIGGLIIKIDDKIIDLSLKSRIKSMEKQLV